MVPSYNDLVPVWLFRQPCELGLDLGKCAPVADISSVEKDVTCWYGWTRAMCV